MAGLLPDEQAPPVDDAQAPAPPPATADQTGNGLGQDAPQQTEGEQGDGVGAQPNVTPEEQKAYEQFVVNCANTISDPKVLVTIRDMFKHDHDKVDALARLASMIVIRVEDDGSQQGAQIDGDVIFHAGAAVVGDLADVARRLGIHKYEQDEINAAFLRAVDMYRAVRVKQGKLDQGEFKQEFDQLKKLDQSGELGQVMPGLKDFAKDNAHDPAKGDLPGFGAKPGSAAPAAEDGGDA